MKLYQKFLRIKLVIYFFTVQSSLEEFKNLPSYPDIISNLTHEYGPSIALPTQKGIDPRIFDYVYGHIITTPLVPLETLLKTITKTVEQTKNYIVQSTWIEPKPENLFTNPEKYYPIEQLQILEDNETICSLGDLHGGVKTLATILQDHLTPHTFRLKNLTSYILSIGDNINCGLYSTYTLYTLAKLKYKNPTQVHLIRGNHESYNKIIAGGFLDELYAQYPDITDNNIHTICHFFDTFISALVVRYRPSNELILFAHGGFEIGDITITDLLNSHETTTYKVIGSLENDTVFIPRLHVINQASPTLKKKILKSEYASSVHTLCDFIPIQFDTGICELFQEKSPCFIIGYHVNNVCSEHFFDTDKQPLVIFSHGGHEYKKRLYDIFRNNFSNNGFNLKYFVRGHQHTWTVQDFNTYYHMMSHIIEGDGVYIFEIPNNEDDTYYIITLGPAPDSKYGLPMEKYDAYEKHSPGAALYTTVTFSYDSKHNSITYTQTTYDSILAEEFINLHFAYREANA